MKRARKTSPSSTMSIKKKRTGRTSSSPTLPILPDDIIFDILSRLPVKSLCRFRCVSKEFRSLISNPQFVKSHFNRSKSDVTDDETNQTLFVNCIEKLYYENMMTAIVNGCNNKDLTMLDFQVSREGVTMVGTCNGLVCLLSNHKDDKFFLLNPSTREHKKLPQDEPHPDNGLAFVGFGYDSINDDYKVIKGYSYYNCINCGDKKSLTTVYSTRTRMWKIIDDHVSGQIMPDAVFLNGYLHWQSFYQYDSSLVSFDVTHEKYNTVLLPDDNDRFIRGLGVLRGCICVGRRCEGELVLWMMKDYGVRESWTKLIRINYNIFPSISIDPICYAKNGQIVALVSRLDSKYLAIWNAEHNSFAKISFSNVNRKIDQVGMYVESLISP